jgi:hypothetical protein
MNQGPDTPNPFDPFGTARTFRDAGIDAWSKALQQFVNTEAYSQATGAALDSYLTASAPFRTVIAQVMTQVLETYNMPTRADVISISERLTNIETRLDDLDAQITAMQRAQARPAQQRATAAQGQTTLPSAAQEAATAQTMDAVVDTLSETQDNQQLSKEQQ